MMLGNGILGKALAGAGTGMAIAGQMAFHSQLAGDLERQHGEITAKLDQIKEGYANQRNDATNQTQKDIHAANNQTQIEVADTQADSHRDTTDAQINARSADQAAKQEGDRTRLDYEYKLKRDLEQFKVDHGSTKTSTMIQNMNYLVEKEIANSPREAFNLLRRSVEKPESDAILELAGTLRRGFGYGGKDGVDRSVADATRIVRSVKGKDLAPKQPAPRLGISDQSQQLPGAAGPTMKSYNIRGQSVTDDDIEYTARQHGITADDVKQQLGIEE